MWINEKMNQDADEELDLPYPEVSIHTKVLAVEIILL